MESRRGVAVAFAIAAVCVFVIAGMASPVTALASLPVPPPPTVPDANTSPQPCPAGTIGTMPNCLVLPTAPAQIVTALTSATTTSAPTATLVGSGAPSVDTGLYIPAPLPEDCSLTNTISIEAAEEANSSCGPTACPDGAQGSAETVCYLGDPLLPSLGVMPGILGPPTPSSEPQPPVNQCFIQNENTRTPWPCPPETYVPERRNDETPFQGSRQKELCHCNRMDGGGQGVDGSVNVVNGELKLVFGPATLPAEKGSPFALNLTHRTLSPFARARDGMFGNGWDYNYGAQIQVAPSGNLYHFPGQGIRDLYTKDTATGNWDSPLGIYSYIRDVGTGGTVKELVDRHGLVQTYTKEGTVWKLTKMADNLGNSMVFWPGKAAIDSHERLIYFNSQRVGQYLDVDIHPVDEADQWITEAQYDDYVVTRFASDPPTLGEFPSNKTLPTGVLTRVVDGQLEYQAKPFYTWTFNWTSGYWMVYDWNGTWLNPTGGFGDDEHDDFEIRLRILATFQYTGGLLTRINSAGSHHSFTYFGTKVNGIADSTDRYYVANDFDMYGRVIEQRYGYGNFSFSYNTYDDYTVVHDRNRNRQDFHYDPSTGLIKRVVQWTNRNVNPADPDAFVTRYTHNDYHEVTSITYPRLNSMRFTYDETNDDLLARGNLLSKTRDPGPWKEGVNGEAQEPLTTTYAYEPKFNLVRTVTDARGTSDYVPPNGGTNVGRYTTTYTYEYEESTLGDVNGDGITTRTGAALVEVVHPSLNAAGVPMPDFTVDYANVARVETWTHTDSGQVIRHVDAAGQVQAWEYFEQKWPLFSPFDAAYYGKSSTKQDVDLSSSLEADLVTAYEHDLDGNPTLMTDARGNSISLQWVPGCLLQNITAPAPLNYETNIAHDANGEVSGTERDMEADGDATTSTTVRDILGNPVKETKVATRPTGAPVTTQDITPVTLYCYDLNDNLILTRRPESANGHQFWDLESTVYDERDNAYMTTRGDILGDESAGSGYYAQPRSPAGACTAPRTHPNPVCRDPTGNYYTDDTVEDVPYTAPPVPKTPPGPANQPPGTPTYTSGPTSTRSPLVTLPSLPSSTPTSIPTLLSVWTPPPSCGDPDTYPVAHGTINSTTHKTYDANNNLKWSADGRGYLTRHLYDGYDRIVLTVDPLGGRSESTYDVVDNIVAERFCGRVHPHSPLSYLAETVDLTEIGRLVGCLSIPVPGALQLYTDRRYNHDEANQAYRVDQWLQDTSTGLALHDGPLTPEDGYTTSLTQYDAAGRVTRTVNDNQHVFATTYNKLGWRMTTFDSVGNTQSWEYDRAGNAENNTHTSVSPDGLLAPRTYNGNATYDQLNRKTSSTSSDGGKLSSAYDGLGSKKAAKDEVGVGKKQTFDGLQRLLRDRYTVYDFNTTSTPVLSTKTTSGAASQVDVTWIGGLDGLKAVNFTDEVPPQHYIFLDDASYDYDEVGGVTTVTGNLVTVTRHVDYLNVTYDYDADGRLVMMKDGKENPTRYFYDPLGRKVGEEFADGEAMTFEHDANDNVVRMVDANGNVVTNTYDAMSRLVETRAERGIDVVGTTRQTFRYDASGRLVESVDAEDMPYAVPQAPSPLASGPFADGDGFVAGFSFESQAADAQGPLAMDADGDGRIRVTVQTPYYEGTGGYEPAVGTFRVSLTGGGAPISDTCSIAAGSTSCDIYVLEAWLFGATNAPLSVWSVRVETTSSTPPRTSAYEVSRNHALFATEAGVQLLSLGSRAAEIDGMENASYPTASTQVTFVNLESGTLPRIPKTYTVQRVHDSHGNVIIETENGLTARSVYDGVGNRVKFTYPNGRVVTSTYDPLERVKEIWDRATDHPEMAFPDTSDPPQTTHAWPGDARIVTYAYFGTQNVLRRTFENGVAQHRDFDAAERVARLWYLGPTLDVLPGFEYNHTLDGMKSATRYMHDEDSSEAYDVDGVKRLTRYDRGELDEDWLMSSAAYQEWDLDDANNWRHANDTLGGSLSESERTHNSRNELTANDVDGSVNAYEYDANGNLRTDGTRTYHWDFRNRLREVRAEGSGDLVAAFDYDAENRRVLRTYGPAGGIEGEAASTATATTYFLDGVHEVQEMDATGLVVLRQYVFGPQVDEVLVADADATGVVRNTDASTREHYLQNELMTVYAITDHAGNRTALYQYDPYGKAYVVGVDETGNELRYAGRRWDGDAGGLYYYRSRYMSPELGRFISSDTIGVWGDRAGLGNGQAYAANAPHYQGDPTGEAVDTTFTVLVFMVKGNEPNEDCFSLAGIVQTALTSLRDHMDHQIHPKVEFECNPLDIETSGSTDTCWAADQTNHREGDLENTRKKYQYLIGWMEDGDHNGCTSFEGVMIADHPSWWRNNWRNDIVALHEVGHLFGAEDSWYGGVMDEYAAAVWDVDFFAYQSCKLIAERFGLPEPNKGSGRGSPCEEVMR